MSTYEKHLVSIWNLHMRWEQKKHILMSDIIMHEYFGNNEWASDCQLLCMMAEYLGVSYEE